MRAPGSPADSIQRNRIALAAIVALKRSMSSAPTDCPCTPVAKGGVAGGCTGVGCGGGGGGRGGGGGCGGARGHSASGKNQKSEYEIRERVSKQQ